MADENDNGNGAGDGGQGNGNGNGGGGQGGGGAGNGGASGGRGDGGSSGSGGGATIPLARFNEVYGQMMEYRVKAAEADTLRTQIGDMQKKLDAVPETIALARSGLDDEGVEIARFLHGKLDPKDRPKLTDWLGSFTDDKPAPLALQAYLKGKGNDGGNGGGERRAPNANQGQRGGPGAANVEKASIEELRTLRERAQASGDPADWKAWSDARERGRQAQR